MPVLTDIIVRKTTKTVWDSLVPGFCLRVTPGGTKTFYLIQGKKRSRTKIGRVGIVTLGEARDKARMILAAQTLGITYQKVIVQSAVENYLEVKRESNRPGTFKETDRLLRKHLLPVLGQRAVESVTPKDVQGIVRDVRAPLFVDGDVTLLVRLDAGLVLPQVRRVRATPDGDQHAVDIHLLSLRDIQRHVRLRRVCAFLILFDLNSRLIEAMAHVVPQHCIPVARQRN